MSAAAGGSVFALCPRAVVQAAAALGLNTAALLRDARISPDLLRSPVERVPLSSYLALYELAVERCREPDFGLYVGHIIYFSGINLHLYMTTICRNLKEYCNLIPSTVRLRGDTGRIFISADGDMIRLEWHPLDERTARWRPLADEMLKSAAEILNAICALPVPVRSAELSYPAPDDTRALKGAFGPNLKFGCELSCLYFPREVLRYPLVDVGLEPDMDFFAGPAGIFSGEEEGDPFLRDIRVGIRRALPSGELTIDGLARDMGVSRRTLQRRLSEHGASFKRILQDVREAQSRRYLDDPRLAITEIAMLLGYSDQASFSNAFKSWCGCAPSEYRQKLLGATHMNDAREPQTSIDGSDA